MPYSPSYQIPYYYVLSPFSALCLVPTNHHLQAEHVIRDDGVVIAKEKSKGYPYLLFTNGGQCFATNRPRVFVLYLECSATDEPMGQVSNHYHDALSIVSPLPLPTPS